MRGNPRADKHTQKKLKSLRSPDMSSSQVRDSKRGQLIKKSNIFFNMQSPLSQHLTAQTSMHGSLDDKKLQHQSIMVKAVGHKAKVVTVEKGSTFASKWSPNSTLRKSNLFSDGKPKSPPRLTLQANRIDLQHQYLKTRKLIEERQSPDFDREPSIPESIHKLPTGPTRSVEQAKKPTRPPELKI